MANLPTTPTWSPDVTQIETTDKVLGGADGVINVQARQLADRTAYLKQEVEATADVAAEASGKADTALAQIAAAEVNVGTTADNAAASLAHKNDAVAAKALTEQARDAAQGAQQQAGESAAFVSQALAVVQERADTAGTSATVAVQAAGFAVAAKDIVAAAKTSVDASVLAASLIRTNVAELAATTETAAMTAAEEAATAAADLTVPAVAAKFASMMNPRGEWATAIEYLTSGAGGVRDTFWHTIGSETKAYVVVQDHTSGVFATDLAAGKFIENDTAQLILDLFDAGSGKGSDKIGFTNYGAGAVRRSHQEKSREQVSLEDYGAKADGVSDDSTALLNAAASGRVIRLQKNKTYKISVDQTIHGDLMIVGGGVLLFGTTTQSALSCQSSVHLEGVTLDGGNVSNELIKCTGPSFTMIGGLVKNVFRASPTDNVTGVQLTGVDFVRVKNVKFTAISSTANGVIGDSIGSVAGIQISGSCADGLIEGCSFSDIHNRATPGGVLQYEDADAIRCYTVSGDQNIVVKNNRFNNVGKRAAKFLGTSNSTYEFSGNSGSSPYIGTVDDAITLGNGMFSVASCYSGSVSVVGNRFIGGVFSQFFEGAGGILKIAEIKDNTFIPEYHQRVNTSQTSFLQVSAGVADDLVVSASGNIVKNVYTGVNSYAKTNIILNNPLIESVGVGIRANAGGQLVVSGNLIKQSASGDATTNGAYGVQSLAVLTVLSSLANVFVGKYDGYNIASQASPYSGVISGCVFRDIVRVDINGAGVKPLCLSAVANHSNGSLNKVLYTQNTTQATVGAAGGASALPATPTGYKREFVNGIEYAIPYYARA